jgi:predicted outer membrane repeat protein
MSKRQRRRDRKQLRHQHSTSKRLAAGAGIAAGATLAATGSAQAADFTVTTLADAGSGSLRQAIDDANANPGEDRVLFASGLSGTITLAAELQIYDQVQVLGPGAGQITVSGGGTSRIFKVRPQVNGSYGDPVAISGLTLTGGLGAATPNTGDDGGAINSRSATLTISNSVVSGNHAPNDGGAIYSNSDSDRPGSLTIRNSTISGNSAGDPGAPLFAQTYGGAIHSYSAVTIEGSTLSGNSAGGDGGAIYMGIYSSYAASLTIRNSTVTGNSSRDPEPGDDGGGIDFRNETGQLTLESSTISGNSSYSGGGVWVSSQNEPTPAINNTILADNGAAGGTGPDIYAYSGASVSFSLIENTSSSTGAGPYSVTSPGPNLLGVDPQLGPLQNNGGATATQALSQSSPALDKGSTTLASDQRGRGRPFDFTDVPNAAGGNGADIGAFELGPPCKGQEATIFSRPGQVTQGTPGADVIVGTSGADRIVADDGDDLICSLGGRDRVSGQRGNDDVDGGGGKDRINGSRGKDRLAGKGGGDRISGGRGKDRLNGGKGKDTLKGGKNRDILKGGPGRDRLFGGLGRDRLLGGAGKDKQKQ